MFPRREATPLSLREEVLADAGWQWTRPRVEDALGDEVEEFRALLADPSVPPASILKALNKRGIKVSTAPLYRWARDARL